MCALAAASGLGMKRDGMRRDFESRILRLGLTLLATTAAFFVAFKLAMWSSVVVHEEPSSIHRVFFDRWLLRFPQESFNLVDFLTTMFLLLGGLFALVTAFWMGERVRTGRAGADARKIRRFFRLAGLGLVWLGFDEIFLIHEFASANLYVHDAAFLAGYAAIALLAFALWWRIVFSNRTALAVLAAGAVLHAGAIGMDFLQDLGVWLPEEPTEMLAAGFYALSMTLYCARLLAATPMTTAIRDLPASAIEPLEPPVARDPAWVH